MSKVTPEHLARQAIVYVRQSTADQVINNLESQRRQYGLTERARQLGWSEIEVIDDDLGRSGSGVARPGFEKLLSAICEEPCRRRCLDRGLPARAQWPGLAYASGVLWAGRHAHRR